MTFRKAEVLVKGNMQQQKEKKKKIMSELFD